MKSAARTLAPAVKQALVKSPMIFFSIIALFVFLVASSIFIVRYFGETTLAAVFSVISAAIFAFTTWSAARSTEQRIDHITENKNEAITTDELIITFTEILEDIAALKAARSMEDQINVEQLRQKVLDKFTLEIDENGAEKFAEQRILDERVRQQEKHLTALRLRLSNETKVLWSFANRNMTIGSLFSFIGIAFLFYFLVTGPNAIDSTTNSELTFTAFAVHFLPRVTFVIFIEIFAFFFLKLYRNGMAEVKYYQNELTNFDLRILALTAAAYANDPELIKIVIERMAAVEKNNFVLKSGETTAELARDDRVYNSDRSISADLKQIIEALRPKS